jgi:hypothetical protein
LFCRTFGQDKSSQPLKEANEDYGATNNQQPVSNNQQPASNNQAHGKFKHTIFVSLTLIFG